MIKRIFVAITLLVMSGCSPSIVPNSHPLGVSVKAPPFYSKQDVSLINHSSQSYHLRAWTRVMIRSLRRELKIRGVHVVENSSKEILLNTTHANVDPLALLFETCSLTVELGIGDHYTRQIRVTGFDAFSTQVACDSALSKAVVEVLNDPSVFVYLTEEPPIPEVNSTESGNDDTLYRMQELIKLYSNGLITEKEYYDKKTEILDAL